MIIGKGDIASVLKDREGVIYFASGVSNSQEADPKAFNRERQLLLQMDQKKCLFYFSTISKFFPQPSMYARHKIEMEQIVYDNFENHCILRIGNITWGNNPNTFLNKMRLMKFRGEPIEIRDEYKYMITKQHLQMLCENLPINQQLEICAFSYMAKVANLL